MQHPIVSAEEWLAARKALLAKEKEWIAAARPAERRTAAPLPWVQIDKEYVFEGPNGNEKLAALFAGAAQLVIKHSCWGRMEGSLCPAARSSRPYRRSGDPSEHQPMFPMSPWRGRRILRSPRHNGGWAGGSDGCRRSVATSTTTSTFLFTPEQIAAGQATYNYQEGATPMEKCRAQRLLQGRAGAIFHTYCPSPAGGEVMLSTYALARHARRAERESNLPTGCGTTTATKPSTKLDRATHELFYGWVIVGAGS